MSRTDGHHVTAKNRVRQNLRGGIVLHDNLENFARLRRNLMNVGRVAIALPDIRFFESGLSQRQDRSGRNRQTARIRLMNRSDVPAQPALARPFAKYNDRAD